MPVKSMESTQWPGDKIREEQKQAVHLAWQNYEPASSFSRSLCFKLGKWKTDEWENAREGTGQTDPI